MQSVKTIISVLVCITAYAFSHSASAQEYLFHPFTPNVLEPKKVVAIDLDKDGDDDYVCASMGDNKVSWFENLGNFRTVQHIISTTAFNAIDVDVADLDNDQDMDIIASCYDVDIVILFINQGNQRFERTDLPRVDELDRIAVSAVGDTDGDGDIDILTGSYGSYGKILFVQTGPLQFTPTPFGTLGRSVLGETQFHDMDMDGDMDVVSIGTNSAIYFNENMGNNLFTTHATITNVSDFDFCIWDVNTDGLPDIVAMKLFQFSQGMLVTWTNHGNWNFTKDTMDLIMEGKPLSMVGDDYDGDGDLDLYVSTDRGLLGGLTFIENIDGHTFVGHTMDDHFIDPQAIEITDFNGDGVKDYVICDEELNYVSILVQNSPASFSEYPLGSSNSPFSNNFVKLADLDQDGYMDVITDQILHNDKNGFFSGQPRSFHGTYLSPLDFDFDGDLDIVAPGNTYGTWIALGHNDGQLHFSDSILISPLPLNFALGAIGVDVNHDQLMDVVTNSRDYGMNLFIQTSAGEFLQKKLDSEAECIYANPADLDQDGDRDILVGNDTHVSWYENIGEDTMIRHRTDLLDILRDTEFVEAGDIDGDGDLDMSILKGWLENDGNLNFTEQHWISNSFEIKNRPRLYDKDEDGDLDVLEFNDNSDRLYWRENDGNGNFTTVYFANQFAYNKGHTSQAADFDLDGDADIYATVGWYESLSNLPQVTCFVFLDDNQNGIQDPGESLFPKPVVSIAPRNLYALSRTPDLSFLLSQPGEYVLSFDTVAYKHYALTTPGRDTVLLNSDFDRDTVRFGVIAQDQIYASSDVILSPVLFCSDEPVAQLVHCNDGTVNHSGTIWLQADPELLTGTWVIPPDNLEGTDLFGWNVTNLTPEECIFIPVPLKELPFIPGFPVAMNCFAVLDSLGFQITSDTFKFKDVIWCSHDPNDKIGFPNRHDRVIYRDECIDYMIRFQNVGNYPATDVVIIDTLSESFDLSTFNFIATSHPEHMYYDIDVNHVLYVRFDNIQLPDSIANEEASHGYFSYTICPKENLPENFVISNTADIYFDNNPAIRTNTSEHIISEFTTRIGDLNSAGTLKLFPVPANGSLHIQMPGDFTGVSQVSILTSIGVPVSLVDVALNKGHAQIDVNTLPSGMYFISLVAGNMHSTGRFIKM